MFSLPGSVGPRIGVLGPSPRCRSASVSSQGRKSRINRTAARVTYAVLFGSGDDPHTQPLEIRPLRAAVRAQLRLPGVPQMVLQLGRARTAALTGRRPVSELLMS